MELKERLKCARESLSFGQKEMAEALRVGLKSWQVYEQGGSVPGGKVFEALVKLGFNGTWLLIGEGPMKRAAATYSLAEGHKNADNTGERRGGFDSKEKRADRSPAKQAAVSYIDAMTDIEAVEVTQFIVMQQDMKDFASTGQTPASVDAEYFARLTKNMSEEGKTRLRTVIEGQLKQAREDESQGNRIGLKSTGT